MIFDCPVGQKKSPNSTEMYPVLFARIPSTFLQSLSQGFQCSRNMLVSLVNLLEPQHCVFCKSNLVSFAPVFPEVSLKSRVLWPVLTSTHVSPRRHTQVHDQPNHLLLVGGEPGQHQLRRHVQPARHHAVEEGALHHLSRGHRQHPGAHGPGKVSVGGGSSPAGDSVAERFRILNCFSRSLWLFFPYYSFLIFYPRCSTSDY